MDSNSSDSESSEAQSPGSASRSPSPTKSDNEEEDKGNENAKVDSSRSPRSTSRSPSPTKSDDEERGNESAKVHSPRSRSTSSSKSDNDDDKGSQSGDDAVEMRSPPSRSRSTPSAKSDSENDEKEAEEGDGDSEMQSPPSPPRSKAFAKLVDSDSEGESEDDKPKFRSPQFTPSPKSDEERKHKDSDDEKEHKESDNERKRKDSNDDKGQKNSDDEKENKGSDDERGHKGSDEETGHRDSDEEAKPMEVDEPIPETRIDVDIPKITTDLGKSVHFVKLPNFLSVETRPFDPSTYEDEIDDEETLDEEGRARLKLKVENTIRWREKFNEKGVFVKESNARFVRWSDGSLSLHLGDEIFNVERQALHGDHNHLFIRQGTGLQGQAVFRTKLTFRPHSTESFTHRKMTMSLADRSTKAQGIKVLSTVGADPEAHRDVLIKKEEDRLKASVRRESKQRRVRERGSKGLSTSYLDDEYSEEENSISIAAIKNRYKKGGSRAHIYSSDEEDGSDLEQGRRLEKAKRLKDSDDEDEDGRSDREVKGTSGEASGKSSSPVPGPSSSGLVSSAVDSD